MWMLVIYSALKFFFFLSITRLFVLSHYTRHKNTVILYRDFISSHNTVLRYQGISLSPQMRRYSIFFQKSKGTLLFLSSRDTLWIIEFSLLCCHGNKTPGMVKAMWQYIVDKCTRKCNLQRLRQKDLLESVIFVLKKFLMFFIRKFTTQNFCIEIFLFYTNVI